MSDSKDGEDSEQSFQNTSGHYMSGPDCSEKKESSRERSGRAQVKVYHSRRLNRDKSTISATT